MSDTGACDPRLAAALRAWAAVPSTAAVAEVHAAFAGARVFLAITATSTGTRIDTGTRLRAESGAELSLLTLVGSAGGRAVPLFLDVGAAVGFRPGARPLPLPGPAACTAALQDGAVAVLLDPPGAGFTIGGPALGDLAVGRVPIAGTPMSARRSTDALAHPVEVDPALVAALAGALRAEPVRAARLLAGPDGPVLGLVPDRPLDAGALAALAARLVPRLAAVLPPGGLDLAVVAPSGPGVPVRLKKRWRSRAGVRPDR